MSDAAVWHGSRRGGMAAIVTGGQFDVRFCVSTNWGPKRQYAIDPAFTLRSFPEETRLSDDLAVEYHFLRADQSDWLSVGKCYRRYNFARRGIRPLRERAAASSELAYSAQAMEVRIRLAVKPVPGKVAEQTPETEPAMEVFCSFARVRDILDELHRQGVARAELCLVGWNRGGHDGRYPQIFPVEPALGGERELRATIRHGQTLGFQIVAHDCYYGAYRISEDWSEEYLRKNPDGQPQKGGVWGGGQSYNICLARADELFAKRDLPRIRALGFRGALFRCALHPRPSSMLRFPPSANPATGCRGRDPDPGPRHATTSAACSPRAHWTSRPRRSIASSISTATSGTLWRSGPTLMSACRSIKRSTTASCSTISRPKR